jgi:hypothetical protein
MSVDTNASVRDEVAAACIKRPKLMSNIKEVAGPLLTPCMLWQHWPQPNPFRYGTISLYGVSYSVHRLFWVLYRGEIPARMFVCHRCDLPACCNIQHLFLGTARDNNRDMWRKGRQGERGWSTKRHTIQVDELRLRRFMKEAIRSQPIIDPDLQEIIDEIPEDYAECERGKDD